MGLRSIFFLIFIFLINNIDCYILPTENISRTILKRQVNEYFLVPTPYNMVFYKENSVEIKPLFRGIKDACSENVKGIARSLLYPIESLIRVCQFVQKMVFGFFKLLFYPQTNDYYINGVCKIVKGFTNYFNHMSLNEKFHWVGYVVTDFIVGYFTPFGLGWKLIFFAKNFIKAQKSIKIISKFKEISKADSRVSIITKTKSDSLLNIKYSFEYMDQVRQSLPDFVLCDGC